MSEVLSFTRPRCTLLGDAGLTLWRRLQLEEAIHWQCSEILSEDSRTYRERFLRLRFVRGSAQFPGTRDTLERD
jgi:hypothetical protein